MATTPVILSPVKSQPLSMASLHSHASSMARCERRDSRLVRRNVSTETSADCGAPSKPAASGPLSPPPLVFSSRRPLTMSSAPAKRSFGAQRSGVSNTGPHATRVFAISELVRSNASIERSTERSEYSTGGLSLSSREEEEALASSASAPKASSNACVASCAKTRKEWLCASAHGTTATRTFLAVSRESSTLFRKEALLEKDLSFLDRTT
mmetsp:Transcript_15526/g.42350  ORF Transcript_15526/g.42350 Transcript_15526/m.42350 type:complete len:210 (-) Transcript_15526:534-1163(-)